MAEHLEDEEQVEALKRWWDENGRSTVVAIGLAVAGTLGWQQYQRYEADQAATASDHYADLVQMRVEGADASILDVTADLLKADHSGSTYAALAALQLAADAVAAEDWQRAERELRWALENGASNARIAGLIELRLARVLAASGDEAGAMAILEAGSELYPVAFAMARGDIHLVAGREQQALSAYEEAERAALIGGGVPALLETKIDSLTTRLGTSDPIEETAS